MKKTILFLLIQLIILSCKDKSLSDDVSISGCNNPLAINFNSKDESCEFVSILCDECDFVVDDWYFDGIEMNIKPGDVIGLDANKQYDGILFQNLTGTPDKPIQIVNCDGKAVIDSHTSYGIKFKNSSNFKLIGVGDENHRYGIKVTTRKSFFIELTSFTTDFEISNIEIAGIKEEGLGDDAGFAGIGAKTNPDCDGSGGKNDWVMRNISIHDNYIHDIGGEGLYVGYGAYYGRSINNCNNKVYGHSIKLVKIFNNVITNVGYDGIQIKNVDENCHVFNNYICNYGTKKVAVHNEGIYFGSGSTGDIYNNRIENGSGNGMMFKSLGNHNIYNNVIINSGENGVYAAEGHDLRWPNGYYNFINNTIVDSKEYGFIFHGNSGGEKKLINNIITKAGLDIYMEKAEFIVSDNIMIQDPSKINFIDYSKGNLKLTKKSMAIDKGKDVSGYGIEFDFDHKKRPVGAGFDCGAYESQ